MALSTLLYSQNKMVVVGVETSCDETSVAVVKDGQLLSNVVSSQINLHAVYGGVVPEVASRQHLKLIDSVIQQAYQNSKVELKDIDAIAVTRGPGLPSALLVGVSAARGLALSLNKPLVPIHHMEAHLYSPELKSEPFIALVVSGGHTLLYHVARFGEHRLLGQTVDDAAGEAFDKAARLLGLSYPGGPQIEKEAKNGNPNAYNFPRPMLDSGDWNFSFSGLKTAIRRTVENKTLTSKEISDLCASFQLAVTDVLVTKTIKAAKHFKANQVALSGGVACNGFIRTQLENRCREEGIYLSLAARNLCTDNAGMIALLAEKKLLHGFSASAEWDIQPDWILNSEC
jgi:N6-L-threonylcarbamoyladenine synthase